MDEVALKALGSSLYQTNIFIAVKNKRPPSDSTAQLWLRSVIIVRVRTSEPIRINKLADFVEMLLPWYFSILTSKIKTQDDLYFFLRQVCKSNCSDIKPIFVTALCVELRVCKCGKSMEAEVPYTEQSAAKTANICSVG